MTDVFMSYAHPNADTASALVQVLDSFGLRTWLDKRMLPGDAIRSVLTSELDRASCVVVLWSAESVISDWVLSEASRALEQQKLIPASIDGTSAPLGFKSLLTADLSGWDGSRDHAQIEALVSAIRAASAKPAAGSAAVVTDSTRHILDAAECVLNTARGWTFDTLKGLLGHSSVDVRAARRLLSDCVGADRSTEELAYLYATLDWLGERPDREAFFSACDRWPPPPLSMRFAHIPDGVAQLGSPVSETGRCSDEPRYELRIDGFLLGVVPVLNRDFTAFGPDHPVRAWTDVRADELDAHPVVRTTWWEAMLFCEWVGGRLPTEAEWEYACRASRTTPYWVGVSLDPDTFNFGNTRSRTTVAGSLGDPNPLGLRDMHGNVWEWCQDVYDSRPNPRAQGKDTFYGESDSRRVARGGSWADDASGARCAFRNRFQPDHRMDHVGFRVAFDLAR